MNVDIQFLADFPEAIPVLASWFFQGWPHRSPDGSSGGFEEILRGRLHRDRLPLALVALAGERPVGTVSLKVQEMTSQPQYGSWLGSLYVPCRLRQRGIGSLLVGSAEETARRLGIRSLYLYTRHPATAAFYARLGWQRLEEVMYSGRPAIVMRKPFPKLIKVKQTLCT